MRGNRSELAPGRKSPWCHVNTPLVQILQNLDTETNSESDSETRD